MVFGAVTAAVLALVSGIDDGDFQPQYRSLAISFVVFAAVLGAVAGFAAGLMSGVLATFAAVATNRLRRRTCAIASAAAIGAGSVTGLLLVALSGEVDEGTVKIAAAAAGLAAAGTAILWRFGGACRLLRPRLAGR